MTLNDLLGCCGVDPNKIALTDTQRRIFNYDLLTNQGGEKSHEIVGVSIVPEDRSIRLENE